MARNQPLLLLCLCLTLGHAACGPERCPQPIPTASPVLPCLHHHADQSLVSTGTCWKSQFVGNQNIYQYWIFRKNIQGKFGSLKPLVVLLIVVSHCM